MHDASDIHRRAAEQHELAAHAHRTAAEHPRRSRRMIHLYSDRVIRPKNRSRPRARNAGVDILRAEGVQAPCIQQYQRSIGRPAPNAAPASAPLWAGLVGHFWRANLGHFLRVPKPNITKKGKTKLETGMRSEPWSTRIMRTSWQWKPTASRGGL